MLKNVAQNEGKMEDEDVLDVTHAGESKQRIVASKSFQKPAPVVVEEKEDPAVAKLKEEKQKLLDLNSKLMERLRAQNSSKSFEGSVEDNLKRWELRCQELQDNLVSKEKEWTENNQIESKKRAELEEEKRKLLDVNSSLMEKLKSLKSSQNSSQKEHVTEATISYTFRWPYGGKELGVAGDWNDWKAIPMEKSGEEFIGKVGGLKPLHRYLYKYVVDGIWQEDHTSPVSQEEMVNGVPVTNNVLVTGPLDSEERVSQLEKERDALYRMNKQLEAAAKKVNDSKFIGF
jgi:hypothetical protein